MPARKNDPPVIRAWSAGLTPAQRQQYLPAVRRLLAHRAPIDNAAVSTNELVAFALAIESDSSRIKAVCALQHFFSRICDSGIIPNDPAKFLTKAVQRAIVEQRLANELSRSGVPELEARGLSWRDVVTLTLAGTSRLRSVQLDDSLRDDLASELLTRIRQAADVQEAQAILDTPLFEYANT